MQFSEETQSSYLKQHLQHHAYLWIFLKTATKNFTNVQNKIICVHEVHGLQRGLQNL